MDDVIGERYDIQEPIGRGGMATIYRAIDLRIGRSVAVKVLRDVYSSDPKFVTRFQREARAASALQHPNIVQVFDYGQSGESYYIVMEYINGEDLRRYLKRNGVLSVERTVEIAHDIALGLGAAHRRDIVHRDVKPQNVLLNDDGLVKLTDFGIASMYKDVEAERLTTTGMTLGTVQYYAPEQAQGEICRPAADVYALGIVMYEMLTGKTPFDGDTPVAVAMRHIQDVPERPSTLNPRIPPALERVIMRCLEKDPRDRYKDGDTLAYQLENWNRASGRPQFAATGPGSDPRSTNARGRAGSGSAPRGISDRGRAPMDIPGRLPNFEASYGVLSTRPNGPAAGTLPRVSGPNGMPRKPDERPKRGGTAAVLIVTTTILLLLLSCVLVVSLSGGGKALAAVFGGGPTPTVRAPLTLVPDFTGKQFLAAQALADSSHLKVTEKDVADTHDKGLVLSQDVLANTHVNYNTNVTLTVSAGPGKVTIPDLIKKSQAEACNALQDLHLLCNITARQPSDTVPFGAVISSSPPKDTKVDPNSVVNLVISSGPAPTATPTGPTPTPSPTAGGPTPTPSPSPTP